MASQFNDAMREFYECPKTPVAAIQEEHLSPTGTVDTVERLEVIEGKGMFVYLSGHAHPVKGAPTPEAMTAQNQVKRVLLGAKNLWPIFFFVPLPKLVHTFNRITWDLISSPYILKPQFMNPAAREVSILVDAFLKNLGVSALDAACASKTLAHLVEYDNAYRYRLLDLMQETHPTKLAWPREIRRLGRIAYERDDAIHQRLGSPLRRVGTQMKRVAYLVSFLLYIPKYRKALAAALEKSNRFAFVIDQGDAYWMSKRDDYKFNGVHR